MTSLTIAETQGERQKALLKMLRRFLDSDDCGQTLMLFAGGLAVLLALVGLAVDVGQLVHTRTDLQKMSDAAVLAAIQDIAGGAGDTVTASTTTETYVASNNASGSVSTGVGFAASSGAEIDAVTVKTSKHVSYIFLRAIGMSGATPTATDTVRVQIVTGFSFDNTTIFP